MVAYYEEFAAEHRGEHLSPVIRWSHVIGQYLNVLAVAAMLSGRRRAAAAAAAVSFVKLYAGHLAEGNLIWSFRYLARHPIWSVRAHFAVANATILGALRR
jgi:hypothetical protein